MRYLKERSEITDGGVISGLLDLVGDCLALRHFALVRLRQRSDVVQAPRASRFRQMSSDSRHRHTNFTASCARRHIHPSAWALREADKGVLRGIRALVFRGDETEVQPSLRPANQRATERLLDAPRLEQRQKVQADQRQLLNGNPSTKQMQLAQHTPVQGRDAVLPVYLDGCYS